MDRLAFEFQTKEAMFYLGKNHVNVSKQGKTELVKKKKVEERAAVLAK